MASRDRERRFGSADRWAKDHEQSELRPGSLERNGVSLNSAQPTRGATGQRPRRAFVAALIAIGQFLADLVL